MTKKTTIQKEPVKLREKKLANGNVSLYLDIYRNGKRQKEYLKLYLIDALLRWSVSRTDRHWQPLRL